MLHDGYSPLWLAVMYLLGAYLAKYDLLRRISVKKWALVYVFCVFFAWAPRMAALWYRPHLWADCYGNLAIEYTSPTIVLCAVALLGIFSRLKLPRRLCRPLRLVSALSFGVYLIHSHPLMFRFWLTDRFAALGSADTGTMVCAVLGSALAISAVCMALDALRLELFRLLRLRQGAQWLEDRIRALLLTF